MRSSTLPEASRAHANPPAALQASSLCDCPAQVLGCLWEVVGVDAVGPQPHVEPSRLGRFQVEEYGVCIIVQLTRPGSPPGEVARTSGSEDQGAHGCRRQVEHVEDEPPSKARSEAEWSDRPQTQHDCLKKRSAAPHHCSRSRAVPALHRPCEHTASGAPPSVPALGASTRMAKSVTQPRHCPRSPTRAPRAVEGALNSTLDR